MSLITFELIKTLEIKTSMIFNLDFADDTILSCSFLFFLIIDLIFLISTAIKKIFNPFAEIIITGITYKKAKAVSEIHRVILGAKIRKLSTYIRVVQTFLCFFTYQFILLYLSEDIISYFIYIFKSKFLAYVLFNHIFKVITYFKLKEESLTRQLILVL